MKHHPEAGMTVREVQDGGIIVHISAKKLENLDEAIHLLNQYREQWARNDRTQTGE